MGFIRPATPGFLVTVVATILLAVVSFCVPFIKSVYFLRATISVNGVKGSIIFGTLGYCVELANGTSCSKPSIGYQLDINGLVGNKLPVQIPQVAVKWVTYALVLHVVALALSAGSAVFGLLAHVREMSMTCCSTCISGFAATVALLAFVFDVVLFFVAKARINAVGSAQMGNAIWLTLAAWVLLFFSGCFYTLGRCCISKRKQRGGWDKKKGSEPGLYDGGSSEQLRLDAVKAEAERKKRQKVAEVGLPAFHEVQPLAARVDGDNVYLEPTYQDNNHGAYGGRPAQGGGFSGGGYVPSPAGSRAVDDYYAPARTDYPTSAYPPAPQQTGFQGGGYAAEYAQRHPQRQDSGYAQSQYTPSLHTVSTGNQYLSTAPQQYGPERYGSPPQGYGHAAGGSSYYSAVSHTQQPTNYSQFDPYDSQQQRTQTPYNVDQNNSTYVNPHAPTPGQHDRSYTLGGGGYGGDGYGTNTLPPLPEHSNSFFSSPTQVQASPPPITTNIGHASPPPTSPLRGPRLQPQLSVRNDIDDSPPMYEAGSSNIQGAWGKS